ncbi:MAG: Uma2 family endonuclease, partial [Bacteroidota bacterium]
METTNAPEAATLPIPNKERYTYADYAQLPEGTPYELIAGELVMAPSPSSHHQRILRRLSWALQKHLDDHSSGELFFAPMDVSLSEDTTVQPDLIFVANERRAIIGEQR